MWRRRKIKKKRFGFKTFLVIISPLIFILVSFLLFKLGLFNIKLIEVKGDQLNCTNEDQLKSALGLFGQNFFTLDKNKYNKILQEKFICIKGANLSRSFPDKVSVTVTGRQPAAVLASLKEKLASTSSLMQPIATPSADDISANFVVDNEGVVFAKESENQSIPRVFIYNLSLSLGDKLKSDLADSYLKILDRVKIFGLTVKDSWVNGDYFIVNPQVPGPKIIFRLDDKIDIQLASLQLILDKAKIDSSELEFIDLRFDKPVVRFAPKR